MNQAVDVLSGPIKFDKISPALLARMTDLNLKVERALAIGEWPAPICGEAKGLVDNEAFCADCRKIVHSASRLDPYDASAYLGVFGFLASSEQRHAAVSRSRTPLPAHLAAALLELGARVGHSPRDAADTAYLPKPDYGWTRSVSELRAGETTRQVETLLCDAVRRLSPLIHGRKTLVDTTPDFLAINAALSKLFVCDAPALGGVKVKFKPYLAPFAVGKTIFPGPDVCQTPGWTAVRDLMGRYERSARFSHSLDDILRDFSGGRLGREPAPRDPAVELAEIVQLAIFELERHLAADFEDPQD